MKEKLTVMLVVAVALLRPDGRVLMQRRRYTAVHGGLWEFPGGKVEPGESPEFSALREIREELSLKLDPGSLAPAGFASGRIDSPGGGNRPLVILLYTCTRWHGEPECRDAEEIGWFDRDALPGLAMPPLDYPLARALEVAIRAERDAEAGSGETNSTNAG